MQKLPKALATKGIEIRNVGARIKTKTTENQFSLPPKFQTLTLPIVPYVYRSFYEIKLEDFQIQAFEPEQPLFMKSHNKRSAGIAKIAEHMPAINRWFSWTVNRSHYLRFKYLKYFGDVVLPYELSMGSAALEFYRQRLSTGDRSAQLLTSHLNNSFPPTFEATQVFHSFSAPFELFLLLNKFPLHLRPPPPFYIAQAQLTNLPAFLQNDFPTPSLVKLAGKGDIYDANLWLGYPPTYTPLHKDPNPNLFVQLAGEKRIRLFGPRVGSRIYKDVQRELGEENGNGAIRGTEMMQGRERELFMKHVWADDIKKEGYEVIAGPGDSLFIPKGWWHSIKSEIDIRSRGNPEGPASRDLVNCSVNWWFR